MSYNVDTLNKAIKQLRKKKENTSTGMKIVRYGLMGLLSICFMCVLTVLGYALYGHYFQLWIVPLFGELPYVVALCTAIMWFVAVSILMVLIFVVWMYVLICVKAGTTEYK